MKNSPLPLKAPKMHSVTQNLESYHSGSFLLFLFPATFFFFFLDVLGLHRSAGFIFLGSKITVDGDCSHEIKRQLSLRRKATTNLDSILKSRDITLPTKAHIVKAMVFLVVT